MFILVKMAVDSCIFPVSFTVQAQVSRTCLTIFTVQSNADIALFYSFHLTF